MLFHRQDYLSCSQHSLFVCNSLSTTEAFWSTSNVRCSNIKFHQQDCLNMRWTKIGAGDMANAIIFAIHFSNKILLQYFEIILKQIGPLCFYLLKASIKVFVIGIVREELRAWFCIPFFYLSPNCSQLWPQVWLKADLALVHKSKSFRKQILAPAWSLSTCHLHNPWDSLVTTYLQTYWPVTMSISWLVFS